MWALAYYGSLTFHPPAKSGKVSTGSYINLKCKYQSVKWQFKILNFALSFWFFHFAFCISVDFPRCCPLVNFNIISNGVHRYKPNFWYNIAAIAPRFVGNFEVPNRAVDMDSRALLACYPRGSFWLMIFRGSMNHGRFTKFWFPNSSTYLSRCKAGLCLCTTSTISIRT